MKKHLLCWLTALALLSAPLYSSAGSANLNGIFDGPSDVYSRELAALALECASVYSAKDAKPALSKRGFEIVAQFNYDKARDDHAHTCAATLATRTISANAVERTLLLISVRGTYASEWYSNFDFAPSHSGDTAFAESFLFAAEDLFLKAVPVINSIDDPIIFLCGHSRGAACANLLGVLLDAVYDKSDIYVYTSATPATIRADRLASSYGNIFNLINPLDVVTRLPLAAWGYSRAGTDVVLGSDPERERRVSDAMDELARLAPDIPGYYNDKHCISRPGLCSGADDETGMTAFELMLSVAGSLTGLGGSASLKSGLLADAGIESLGEVENDFTPLLDLLEGLSENGGERGAWLLDQHMPATYIKLMEAA